ncbi:MAG TPA: CARDB domain-containing protein, partial [Anaerolineales bacterium]|nr:CARDB domain-containing protein [Anaerolineales bacterium]
PLANQEVKFILAIHAHGSAEGDRALWVNPIISRVGVVSNPTITPSSLPDLTISNVYLGMQGIPDSSPNCVPNYGSYEIRATIQNRGQTQAVNIPVVETSTGAQSMIGLLRAGQSTELYFPAISHSATYNLVVDPQNKIPELDETNNSFSYPAVTPTPPVLCTPEATPTFTPTPTPVPPTNAMLIWQSADLPCKTASFWADHMTYNYCPPSLSPVTIVPYTQMPAYTSRLPIWMTAYAPFTVQTLAGLVSFNGGGYVVATPAEQRMIAEWAMRMFNDASGGNPSPSSTPVVSGHFSGDNMCYDISVYRDGQSVVVSCLSTYIYPNPKGYLDANELLYFYRWMDSLQPYQDASPYRTISFAWNGERPATFAETLSMEALVNNIERKAAGEPPNSGGGVPVPVLLSEVALANQLGILPGQIQVSNIEPVNYPDACLGTGESPCEPVAVSGYRILLNAQNMLYEFHTDANGYDIRQFGSPQPVPPGAGG